MLQLKKGNRLDLAVDQILVNPDQPRKVFDEEELEELKGLVVDCMENVIKLAVPLTVSTGYGKNWYEAH